MTAPLGHRADTSDGEGFALLPHRTPRWERWLADNFGRLAVVGATLAALGIVVYNVVPRNRSDNVPGWAIGIAIALWVAGALAVVLPFSRWSEAQQYRTDPDTRADELATALKTAIRIIEATRFEVERGKKELAELTRRIRQHKDLAHLNDPEATAVAALVQEQLRRSGRRNTWIAVGLNALFFMLGVGVAVVIAVLSH